MLDELQWERVMNKFILAIELVTLFSQKIYKNVLHLLSFISPIKFRNNLLCPHHKRQVTGPVWWNGQENIIKESYSILSEYIDNENRNYLWKL